MLQLSVSHTTEQVMHSKELLYYLDGICSMYEMIECSYRVIAKADAK